MEIKTKFRPGQEVFVRNKYGVTKEMVIRLVRATVSKDKTYIWYDLSDKNEKNEDCFPEERIFLTRYDSEKERKEHEELFDGVK